MTVETLRDKFVYHVEEAYYVERRQIELLDQLATDVADEALRDVLVEHREQTREHVERLEDVFETVDERPDERPSSTFDALIEERVSFLESAGENEDMRDLYDLGAALKGEHLEIATYELLMQLARRLDMPRNVLNLLDETLDEERETRAQLKSLTEDSTLRRAFTRLAG